jgi:hypothetical protein
MPITDAGRTKRIYLISCLLCTRDCDRLTSLVLCTDANAIARGRFGYLTRALVAKHSSEACELYARAAIAIAVPLKIAEPRISP